MSDRRSASFTLRFRDPRVHDLLGVVAKRRGTSMNALAEELLGRELRLEAAALRDELETTLQLLQSYVPTDTAADAAAIADGEANLTDPLQARMIERPSEDAFRVVDALADALER